MLLGRDFVAHMLGSGFGVRFVSGIDLISGQYPQLGTDFWLAYGLDDLPLQRDVVV